MTESSVSPRTGEGSAELRIVPANAASADDLETVFGGRGDPATCRCQWFKMPVKEFGVTDPAELTRRLVEQSACGHPHADSTAGLVAYLDGEPVGWCAVEPRTAYSRLRSARTPWVGREEDRDDPSVWSITCFVVRVGFRRRGIARALARAAVDRARDRGARAVEGYPRAADGTAASSSASLYVGTESIFAAAGMETVARPTANRVVMRREL
jgi:ribosomal protein S18 acetylase RimI-like enzyme